MKRFFKFMFFACAAVMISGLEGFAQELSNLELSEKIASLEEKIGSGSSLPVKVSGVIEFEAGYEKQDNTTTDFSTATVDLGVEAKINDYITGSFVFTYNDEDGDVELDEAVIWVASEGNPFYAGLGHFVVPFGVYNTRFISDPMTLDIGETTQNTVMAGFANDIIDINAAFFNGEVNETGKDDDNISKYVVSAAFKIPSAKNFSASFGGSLISDITESDVLEELAGDEVDDFTIGYSVFFTASVLEKVFFDAEYVAAADDIAIGGDKKEPNALNLELGLAVTENIEAALRYESADDYEIETRYGIAASWGVLDNTSLSFEYLRSEFEDKNADDSDTITAQLAIEF
ncbi:MAG: LbtU family siderophore porin [Desulfobacteraceae bacterium]